MPENNRRMRRPPSENAQRKRVITAGAPRLICLFLINLPLSREGIADTPFRLSSRVCIRLFACKRSRYCAVSAGRSAGRGWEW